MCRTCSILSHSAQLSFAYFALLDTIDPSSHIMLVAWNKFSTRRQLSLFFSLDQETMHSVFDYDLHAHQLRSYLQRSEILL